MSLGARVRQLRRAHGFRSIKALADAAGIPYSVLYNVESGATSNPQKDTLERLATALHVPVDELLVADEARTCEGADCRWLWRSRFAELKPSGIMELRNATVEERALWCIRQITTAVPANRAARLLDMSEEELAGLLSGRGRVTPECVDLLHERCQVPINWLINGDPGPIDPVLKTVLNHPDAGAYLLVIAKAMDARILPELLERQIDLWMAAVTRRPPT